MPRLFYHYITPVLLQCCSQLHSTLKGGAAAPVSTTNINRAFAIEQFREDSDIVSYFVIDNSRSKKEWMKPLEVVFFKMKALGRIAKIVWKSQLFHLMLVPHVITIRSCLIQLTSENRSGNH